MVAHELKIWPEYFENVYYGYKRFEVRKNDRVFKVGDDVRLREWDPKTESYTGEYVDVRITYVLNGPLVIEGLTIFGFVLLD